MRIEKFRHVDNGKTIYAVVGASDTKTALIEVCRYKKDAKARFMKEHKIYKGLIKKNKSRADELYMIDTDTLKKYKNYTPCYVVARNSIDLVSYMN